MAPRFPLLTRLASRRLPFPAARFGLRTSSPRHPRPCRTPSSRFRLRPPAPESKPADSKTDQSKPLQRPNEVKPAETTARTPAAEKTPPATPPAAQKPTPAAPPAVVQAPPGGLRRIIPRDEPKPTGT